MQATRARAKTVATNGLRVSRVRYGTVQSEGIRIKNATTGTSKSWASLTVKPRTEKTTNAATKASPSARILACQRGRESERSAVGVSPDGRFTSLEKECATRPTQATKKHPSAVDRPALERQKRTAGSGTSRQTTQAGRSAR